MDHPLRCLPAFNINELEDPFWNVLRQSLAQCLAMVNPSTPLVDYQLLDPLHSPNQSFVFSNNLSLLERLHQRVETPGDPLALGNVTISVLQISGSFSNFRREWGFKNSDSQSLFYVATTLFFHTLH